jgi:site-specific DNA-methyltransferase (adenine-specific)
MQNKEPKVQQIAIDKIKPYEKNPRINDNAVPFVANSIKEFGFKVPIVVDSNYVIIGGHTRYKAAQKLGLETVPVIVADDLSEAQVKAFRLADNKVAEIAEWDDALLGFELKELEDVFNFDMDPFGFQDIVVQEQPTGDDDDFDSESAVENIVEPVTQPGDLWILGRHRLLCADSCDEKNIKRLVGDAKIDLYLTDPPYNVAYKGGTGMTIENDNMDSGAFIAFLTDAFAAADSVLKPGCSFYIWHASREIFNFYSACFNIPGWMPKEHLIWVKNRFTFGKQDYQWRHEPCIYGWKEGAAHYFIDDRKQSTVLEFDKPARNGIHPTMKPVELFELQINNSSRKGENVLDSFGGSGTTIIACEKQGRTGFSCELAPKYADAIVLRWQNLTGKDAMLLQQDGTMVSYNTLKSKKES